MGVVPGECKKACKEAALTIYLGSLKNMKHNFTFGREDKISFCILIGFDFLRMNSVR